MPRSVSMMVTLNVAETVLGMSSGSDAWHVTTVVQDVVFRTPVRPVRGKFVLSDAPGLGLEIDESELQKRMIPWTSSAASGSD